MRSVILAVLAAAVPMLPAQPQALEQARAAFRPPTDATAPIHRLAVATDTAPTGAMIISGLGVGAAGVTLGAWIGASMEQCGDDEWFCGLAGGLVGGSIGATLGVPIGVHGASSRAPLGAKLGTSILIGAAAWALAAPTYGISLLAAPFVQLGFGIHQEHRATRKLAGPD